MWKAAWCFYDEGNPDAEAWVKEKALAILDGRSLVCVAAAIGRKATRHLEGTCRHLAKDRMDLTGARWGLGGAEAILKLRALRCNGEFDQYWRYHLEQERQRVHPSRYADNAIPHAA